MDDSLLADLAPSWILDITNENLAEETIRAYTRGVNHYLKYCRTNGVPATLDKDTVREWMAAQTQEGRKPATIRLRLQALRQYGNWLVKEREIPDNPIASLKSPKVDVEVVEALTQDQIAAMIKACGNDLAGRRDEALIRFMTETGARSTETVNIQIADLDLASKTAIVRRGKGGVGRVVPFSAQCAGAIDRYLRQRRREGYSMEGPLWKGLRKGKAFGYSGLLKTLSRRAEDAGVTRNFHLHLLRNTAATRWLAAGGSEQGLMAVAGWKNRAMLDRYTRASASDRAISEAQRLSLGDF